MPALTDRKGRLLGIVGKRLSARGVITHDELPAMIARLEAAVAADREAETEHKAHDVGRDADYREHQNDSPVGLAQRAFPFLVMLRESQKRQADIIWGI